MKEGGLDWSCYYHIRDYQVEHELFAPFMSKKGAAFMTRWWNRMPQFDGLIDYQNHVRPSYFTFKLLSRLTGEKLRIASSDPAIHAFATHDDKFEIDSLLFWNYSKESATIDLACLGLPRDSLNRQITLDALAASDDENVRLFPEPSRRLKKGDYHEKLTLEPYAIKFWSFE
jgi:hypothetical protein